MLLPPKTFAELRRAAAVPQTYVATMTKTKRTGKIFIDYFAMIIPLPTCKMSPDEWRKSIV
ncbi:MAG TPA: hypothetical protein VJQ25_07965 [Nitrospira sp.]|jgi:hypothetical protein|nr:hypothetical protein [Nitrospira sp.]